MSKIAPPSAPVAPQAMPISGGVTQPGTIKPPGSIDASKLQAAQMKAEQQTRIAQQTKTMDQSERNPALWDLTPMEDGNVMAVNTITQRVFTGTTKEFSKMLRGE